MSLNTALSSTKRPYFIALLAVGMCMDYLLKQSSITRTIICVVICLYAVLKPNIFCLFPKDHEYDEYDIMSALPGYLMMYCAAFIAVIIANHIGYVSLDPIAILLIPLLTLLFIGLIDKSRYS